MSINSIGGASSNVQPTQAQPRQDIGASASSEANVGPQTVAPGTNAISEQAVKENIERLNELLEANKTHVTMEYDHLSSPKMVNIIDTDSGETIKKMPPEAVVEIAEKARNYVIGLMIDKTV